jgi:hypothetical protein
MLEILYHKCTKGSIFYLTNEFFDKKSSFILKGGVIRILCPAIDSGYWAKNIISVIIRAILWLYF